MHLNTSVTVLTLLSEVRSHCEANNLISLKAIHECFKDAVTHCTRPTRVSNPSFTFFADWIARKTGLVQCIHGRWQMLSLDCWQIVEELQPDDHEAWYLFWRLLEEFCGLDERVVETVNYGSESDRDILPLRCELIQLYPEEGVYCRCYIRDEQAFLKERIGNFGFFESSSTAKAVAEVEAHVPHMDWKRPVG
jgi:hypothetical protein